MRAYELLNEYKATPTAIARMAKNVSAIAGFEMEMVAGGSDYLDDSEPDYSMDESAYDIDDIIRFFDEDDMNDRYTLRSAQQQMFEEYQEWRTDQVQAEWNSENHYDIVKEYILNNEYSYMDLAEMWLEKYREANDLFADQEPNEDVIKSGVEEMIHDMVVDSLNDKDEHYENAKEEWVDEWLENDNGTESDWLSDIGISSMSDVPDQYDLVWPYYNNRDSVNRDTIAAELSGVLGRPARASDLIKNKHPANTYLVVEDTSIQSYDGEENVGFEIVSPPLPLYAMLDDYRRIVRWANSNGHTTNDTTGLHMNVSLRDAADKDLDYVKLALLLGEEYLANIYDRFDNYYARSSVEKLRMRADTSPDRIEPLLMNMRRGLNQIAIEEFHNGWVNKFTGIFPHDGRVEFRFPGGNYLDMDIDVIDNTLMRCVVALDAAMDPAKFRKEYLKKLYKLLQPYTKDEDILNLYVRYSAGEMPRAALKSFVKQRRTEKRMKSTRVPDEDMVGHIVDGDTPVSGGNIDHAAVQRALGQTALQGLGSDEANQSWSDVLRARLKAARDA